MWVIKLLTNFKKKISYKVFFSVFSLLILFTIVIYLMLILFFPKFYYNYQIDNVKKQVNEIVTISSKNQTILLKNAVDNFAKNTDSTPIVLDENNNVVYIPGFFKDFKIEGQNFNLQDVVESNARNKNQIAQIIHFKNKNLFLIYSMNVQNITDMTQVLIQFSPYFFVFLLLLSTFVSYLFSKKMVAPLKEMNSVAKKMVILDFKAKIKVKKEDELGQLSMSLNHLSVSLENALSELQVKNQLLVLDLERERELDNLRKNFMMAISHELKSPLTSAMGIVEAMEYKITPYDDREKYLKITYQTLNNMATLIQEMLEISRLEQTSQVMQLTKIDLNKQLKAIVEKLQTNPEFQEKEIIWSLESSLLIKTKEQMLQKVLQNIANNAFLYSQKKGKIKITTKQLDNYWYCSIYNTTSTDSLKNELTKLFEPFYRLEKSGNKNTGGSGLGLFLVKQFLSNLNIKYEFKIIEDGVLFEIWGNS